MKDEQGRSYEAHFNNLTCGEAERLNILIGQASNVILEASKILRHGFDEHHPKEPSVKNRNRLERTLGDLFYSVHLLQMLGDVDSKNVDLATKVKAETVQAYTHHQPLKALTDLEKALLGQL